MELNITKTVCVVNVKGTIVLLVVICDIVIVVISNEKPAVEIALGIFVDSTTSTFVLVVTCEVRVPVNEDDVKPLGVVVTISPAELVNDAVVSTDVGSAIINVLDITESVITALELIKFVARDEMVLVRAAATTDVVKTPVVEVPIGMTSE